MTFEDRFIKTIQQDIKIFIFFNILSTLFRIIFLVYFREQLVNVTPGDIVLCLWYGFLLSRKLSGCIMAVSFLFCSLPYIVKPKWPEKLLHQWWGSYAIFILTLLFVARIPYYKIFNSGYNIMLLNGLEDDWHAIFQTAVAEYHLWANLAIVVVATLVLCFLLIKVLQLPVYQPTCGKAKKALTIALLIAAPIFFILVRFGGGYSYDTGINWEQAALFRSHLLNEAVLDDGQGLMRADTAWARLNTLTVDLNEKDLRNSIKLLGGNPEAATLEDAFSKENKRQGQTLQAKQVVLIVGESHAHWPFMERYKDMHLVDKEKARFQKNATQLAFMIPGGDGTMRSLNVLIDGLPDNGMYENYAAESFRSQYATGIANTMQKLGYKTIFWYGGIGSWQDVGKLTLAQGFAEFHSGADGKISHQGVWGIPDAELFALVNKYIEEHKNEKTFHCILTTSNHPPYAIDVGALGYDKQLVARNAPSTIPTDDNHLNQLGHIWYADLTIDDFIGKAQQQDPSALFVVTGDHAERFSFKEQEDEEAIFTVPCIFYGRDVDPAWFESDGVGAHGQITPTLVELLSPTGYKYTSIYPSLLTQEEYAFNKKVWATNGDIGTFQDLKDDELSFDFTDKLIAEEKAAEIVTAWRVVKGNKIK